MSVINIYKV